MVGPPPVTKFSVNLNKFALLRNSRGHNMPDVMAIVVIVLIVLVQAVQSIGDRLARRLNKRLRHS